MIPEVDISDDLLPRHRGVMSVLRRLSIQVPPDQWCLVGGMMVLVVGRMHGVEVPRASTTKDGDIIVDVWTDPEILRKVTYSLTSQGFRLEDRIGNNAGVARCTYSFGNTQLDVLCPDGATEGMMVSDDGARSIAIPGGTRALQLASLVDIYFSDEEPNAVISVPSLQGAIVAKASAAVDKRTSGQPRHIQDTAFLLSLVDRPQDIRATWSTEDIDLLRRLAGRFGDRTDPVWEYLSDEAVRRSQAAVAIALI